MITKILAGLTMMVILVLTAYSAYGVYYTWNAAKRQELRLDAIEKKIGAAPAAPQAQGQPAQSQQGWSKRTGY